ncbi:MAG: LysM peptidoglycan-binding domain-containing protein [Clostridia bacterium]|nr:LysM peptidoglycan-binding domain-containing protein [Clostridia bacterium]
MYIVHKVTCGETIAQIARDNHCTTSKIKKLNGISSTSEGERLLIELLEGTPYIVKPFDTLSKIAEVFGVSEQELCQLNGVNEVYVGEVIVLPTQSV